MVRAIAEELKTFGVNYAPYFTFTNDSGNKTSHHVILASKADLADRMMRRIFAKYSSSAEGGVASFGFNPVEKSGGGQARNKRLSSIVSATPTRSTTSAKSCSRSFKAIAPRVTEIMAGYSGRHTGSPVHRFQLQGCPQARLMRTWALT